MLDPVTIGLAYQGIKLAVTHADDAVKTVKKMVAVGHEIHECYDQLRTFFVAQGKVTLQEAKIAKAKKETPELFEEVDPTTQAFDIVIAKRKLAQQEYELQEMMIWSGNGDLYREMCEVRAQIINDKKEAELAVKRKAEKEAAARKRRIDNALDMANQIFISAILVAIVTVALYYAIDFTVHYHDEPVKVRGTK